MTFSKIVPTTTSLLIYIYKSHVCIMVMLSDLQTLGFKTHTDVNESYELFQSTLISHFNDHYPLQTKNI